MRLPGTINCPNTTKRGKGRRYAPSSIIKHTNVQYCVADFPKASPAGGKVAKRTTVTVSGNVRVPDLFTHDETKNLKSWVIRVLMDGYDAQGEKTWKSRSEAVFACACEMVRSDVSDEVMYSIFTDPDYKISESVLTKKNVEREVTRVIGRAREFALDPDLAGMNAKHAVIEDMGGKCRIVNESFNPARKPTFSTVADFLTRYANRKRVLRNADGEEKSVPLAAWWLKHADRRTYERTVFAPDECEPSEYNTWGGFSCEPCGDGDCSLYLAHILDNICRGDEELYNYLIQWMARAVQFPGEVGRVAIVARGRMGTGKGQFVQHFGRLFGRHFITVTKPDHITGKFNAHMGECVVLFADEAFYAGDRAHESILKTLVTESDWLIEKKGIDADRSRSCLHIIMSSNSDWIVPTDADDRRFCIIDVGDARMQDSEYFKALKEQMSGGGYAALLHLLQNTDISNFNPEAFPRTKEHDRQRALSLKGIDLLIATLCHQGGLPFPHPRHPDITITSGEENGVGFYAYVKSVVPDLKFKASQQIRSMLTPWECLPWNGARVRGVRFPPLADLRALFVAKHGPMTWEHNVTEWSAADPVQGGTDDAQIPF